MSKTFFVRRGVACAAAVAGLGLTASPAIASVGHRPFFGPTPRAAPPVHMLASGITTSPYLGGYLLAPSEGITTVSSTFKLPAVTCPVADTGILSVGDALSTSADSGIQPEDQDDATAQVFINCADGSPNYLSSAGNDYSGSEVAANAGDVIQTRIAETPSGQTIETVNDLTSGYDVYDAHATVAGDSQIILGAQSMYQQGEPNTAIPKFSKIAFSNVQVGGLYWNQVSPAPTPYALNQDGYYNSTQIVPSNVPAKPATTFTLTERSYQ